MKKLLYDFFPILLFFIAYKTHDIFVATGVAIVAAIIQVGYSWWKNGRVEKMHLVSLGLIVVLGGMTLILKDNRFIMWKPTMVNWLFAIAFLGSEFIGKKSFIQRMLDQQIDLPATVWTKLNLSWVGFFIVSGVANLYVAFNFSEEIWVNFKLFGLLALTILFVIIQGIFLAKYMPTESEAVESKKQTEADI